MTSLVAKREFGAFLGKEGEGRVYYPGDVIPEEVYTQWPVGTLDNRLFSGDAGFEVDGVPTGDAQAAADMLRDMDAKLSAALANLATANARIAELEAAVAEPSSKKK
jgi:hypothetical protein